MHRVVKPFFVVIGLMLALSVGCVEKKPAQKAQKPKPTLSAEQKKTLVLSEAPANIAFPTVGKFIGAGGEIEVLGADVNPRKLTPGKDFTLTLYFKAVKATNRPQRVFAHVESYAGPRNRSGADHSPVLGKYATNEWKPGEILVDAYKAELRNDVYPGKAKIWIGFFDGDKRMNASGPVVDKENRIMIAEVDVSGDTTPPNAYEVVRIKGKNRIKVDGKLTEAEWAKAPEASLQLESGKKPPVQPTVFKALWDDENIYFGVRVTDKDIASSFTKRDEPLFKEDAVEFFFDADGDLQDYQEIEVSPAGVLFDATFSGMRDGQNLEWNPPIDAKLTLDGTLSKKDDEDKSWTLEMAIPLKEIANEAPVPPKPGDLWRANIYRIDISQKLKREATEWSPVIKGDFHQLHRFGVLKFVLEPTKVTPPETDKAAKVPTQAVTKPAVVKPAIAQPVAAKPAPAKTPNP